MRVFRAVAGVAACVLILSACAPGASPSPGATSQPPASSASGAPATSISVADFLALMAQGLANLKTYTVEISVKGPSIDMTGSGVVERVSATTANSHLSMTNDGRDIELVIFDGEYYVKSGGRWIKLDKSTFGSMGVGTTGDIGTTIEAAKKYMKDVAIVGPEAINGVACTHYRVTMDAVALEKMYGNGFTPKEKTFDWDVWMDATGLVHQAASSVNLSKGTITNTTVMSKFNEPVTITPPKV